MTANGPVVENTTDLAQSKPTKEEQLALNKQSMQAFYDKMDSAEQNDPFAKMEYHEYKAKVMEAAEKWPQFDAEHDGKVLSKEIKRKQFDELEEKLRSDLEALSLIEKQVTEGPKPQPQNTGMFGGWFATPTTPKATDAQVKHTQLEQNKQAIALKAAQLKLRLAIEANARDVTKDDSKLLQGETIDSAYTYKATPVDMVAVKAESGTLLTQFKAQKKYQQNEFGESVLAGKNLAAEAIKTKEHQEALAKMSKALYSQPSEESVARDMKEARRKLASRK